MSPTTYHIVDTPLPLNEDYSKLMDDALAFVQAHMGSEWTNLNPSDPGVTILEQVCYALTELGYCNNFDIADILTNAEGELDIKNQFYQPQEILPTAPITIDDYRKYLIDGVSGITNVMIVPLKDNVFPLNSVYRVYLQIDQQYSDKVASDICKAAFYYLNQSRNLGELFLLPQPLAPQPFSIGGTIAIENGQAIDTVLQQIQTAIAQFIFPAVTANGYNSLAIAGADIDTVLNGPLLQKGYILSDSLGSVKNLLWPIDLVTIVQGVPGVASVSGLTLYTAAADGSGWMPQKSVSSSEGQVLSVDVTACATEQALLVITVNGTAVTLQQQPAPSSKVNNNPNTIVSLVYGETADYTAHLPQGSFRDINTYYPLQNTFPNIYGLGGDGTDSNGDVYKVAQVRQLQGYLTLMDQVLANQFSQLANLGSLFSFTNAVTGTPAQVDSMKAQYDRQAMANTMYPAPYRVFSPAYYYQPLYAVPGIQPLLKDGSTFNFSYSSQANSEATEKYWKAYQADPYNAYMFGLMQLMTDAETDLARRNEILNHLLARHGESPAMIDTFINGSVYTGNKAQDAVIFKSLYLQHYALLSYNRCKAYNYLGADVLGGCSDMYIELQSATGAESIAHIFAGDTVDFIVQSGKINQVEKIQAADLVNYAALELKLNLLLGLRVQYRNFIANNFEAGKTDNDLRASLNLAYWLLHKRRGLIMIETALLLKQLSFQLVLTADPTAGPYYAITAPSYTTAVQLNTVLAAESQTAMAALLLQGYFVYNEQQYPLQPLAQPNVAASQYLQMANNSYWIYAQPLVPALGQPDAYQGLLRNQQLFVFPQFIPQFATQEFQQRVNFLIQQALPVTARYQCLFVDGPALMSIVDAYVNWHNGLRYQPSGVDANQCLANTLQLITSLSATLGNPT